MTIRGGIIFVSILLNKKTINRKWASIVPMLVFCAHNNLSDKQHNRVINRADKYVWNK